MYSLITVGTLPSFTFLGDKVPGAIAVRYVSLILLNSLFPARAIDLY
jgi:hypothetical protein